MSFELQEVTVPNPTAAEQEHHQPEKEIKQPFIHPKPSKIKKIFKRWNPEKHQTLTLACSIVGGFLLGAGIAFLVFLMVA